MERGNITIKRFGSFVSILISKDMKEFVTLKVYD
jgi:hypothetical protein